MSLHADAPSPAAAPSSASTPGTPVQHASCPAPREADVRHVEGLDGPVELRRSRDGYWQVWPRPTPESLRRLYAEDFYDKDHADYLERVDREREYWDATWSMRRELMEAALPAGRRRLLDVGSSGGFLLDHFRRAGWSVKGIEPSESAARFARERFDLEVFCGELLEHPAEADGFDALHSAQVLEHVLDPDAFVAHAARLLAPDGILYLEVPNDFNVLQETAHERLGKSRWWVAPRFHLNYFDYASLSRLLARHGLEEIDRLASFPIEMFLLMGDDYVGHPEVGSACHARRMGFERALIESGRIAALVDVYRALARASLGRTCGILARKVG